MKHLRLLAAACTLCGALASCGQSPTLGAAPDDRARMDAVTTYGGGSFVPEDSSTVSGDGTGTADDDCTAVQRGGWSLGSGNLTEPAPCS